MNSQTQEQPEASGTNTKTWLWIVAATAAVIIGVAGVGAWYFLIRDNAPDAVDSETAISALEG